MGLSLEESGTFEQKSLSDSLALELFMNQDRQLVIEDHFKSGEKVNLNFFGKNIGHLDYGANGYIYLEIHQPLNVIITSKMICSGIVIRAPQSNITFDTGIHIEDIDIAAKNIEFKKDLLSTAVVLNASEAILCHGKIRAKELLEVVGKKFTHQADIIAAHLSVNVQGTWHNISGKVKILNKAEICVQRLENGGEIIAFCELDLHPEALLNKPTAKIISKKLFSFSGNEFSQQGKFIAHAYASINAKNLTNTGYTFFHAKFQIAANYFQLQKNGYISCGEHLENNINVRQEMIINGQMVIKNSTLSSPVVKAQGFFAAEHLTLNCRELDLLGDGNTLFKHCKLNCDRYFQTAQAKVQLKYTDFQGECLELQDHAFMATDLSKLRSSKILLAGNYVCDKSNLQFKDLEISGSGKADIKQSEFFGEHLQQSAQSSLMLTKTNLVINGSDFFGNNVWTDIHFLGNESRFGGAVTINQGQVLLAAKLTTDINSKFCVDGAMIRSDLEMQFNGAVHATNHAKFVTRHFGQASKLVAKQTDFYIDKYFKQENSANATWDHSILTGNFIEFDGCNNFTGCQLQFNQATIANYFSTHNDKLRVEKTVTLAPNSRVILDKTRMSISDDLQNRGALNLTNHTVIHAKHLHNFKTVMMSSAALRIKESLHDSEDATWSYTHSSITAKYAILSGQSNLNHCSIKADHLYQWGHLTLKDVDVDGEYSVTESVGQTQVFSSNVKLNHFATEGSTALHNSTLQTQKFDQQRGSTQLNHSTIIANQHAYTHEQSNLSLENHSAFKSGQALFNGFVKVVGLSQMLFTNAIIRGKSYFDDAKLEAKDALYLSGQKHQFNQSLINAQSLVITAPEVTLRKSHSIVHDAINILKRAKVIVMNSLLKSDKSVTVLGNLRVERETKPQDHDDPPALVLAPDITVYGEMYTSRGQIIADQSFDLKSHAYANFKNNSVIIGKDILLNGNTAIKESMLQAKNHLVVKCADLEKDSCLKARDIVLTGMIKATKSRLEANESIHLQDKLALQSNNSLLHSKRSITLDFSSQIKGESIKIETDTFNNQGQVKLEKVLLVDVERCINYFGTLNGGEQTKIDANNYFLNAFGYVGGANTTITAGRLSLNLFGDLQGSDSLTVNSLIALNVLGSMRSWNTSVNSIFDLNLGVIAPLTTPSSWDAVLSRQRLMSVSRLMLSSVFPAYSCAINFASSVAPFASSGLQGLYQTGKAWYRGEPIMPNFSANGIYDAIQQKWQSIRSAVSSAKLKDILPTILNIKNTVTVGVNLYQSAKSFKMFTGASKPNLVSHFQEHFNSNLTWSALEHIGSVFGPMYTSNSIFSFNTGINATVNSMETSFFSSNYGVKFAAQSLIQNSYFLQNEGQYQTLHGAMNLSGNELTGHGEFHAPRGLRLEFNTIQAQHGSRYHGNQVDIQAKQFSVDDEANVNLEQGRIQLERDLRVNKNASFAAAKIAINANSILNQGGNVFLHQTQTTLQQDLHNEQGSTTNLFQSSLTARNFIENGTTKLDQSQMKLSGDFSVAAHGNYQGKDSIIVADGKANIAGTAHTQGGQFHMRGDLDVNKGGSFKALDASIKGHHLNVKGVAHIEKDVPVQTPTETSVQDFNASPVQKPTVDLALDGGINVDQDGKLTLKGLTIETMTDLNNKGETSIQKSSYISQGSIHTFTDSNTTVTESNIKATHVQSDGKFEATRAIVDLDGKLAVGVTGILLGSDNQITAQQKVENRGDMQLRGGGLHTRGDIEVAENANFKTHNTEVTGKNLNIDGTARLSKDPVKTDLTQGSSESPPVENEQNNKDVPAKTDVALDGDVSVGKKGSLTLDGISLSAMSANLAGKTNIQNSTAKFAKTVTTVEDSESTVEHSSIQAQKFIGAGAATMKQTQLALSQRYEVTKTGNINTANSNITAETAGILGIAHMEGGVYQTQGNTDISQGGKFTTHNSEVYAHDFNVNDGMAKLVKDIPPPKEKSKNEAQNNEEQPKEKTATSVQHDARFTGALNVGDEGEFTAVGMSIGAAAVHNRQKINLENSSLQSESTIKADKNSETNARDSQLHSKDATTLAGKATLHETLIIADKNLVVEKSADLNTHHVQMQGQNIHYQGQTQYQGFLNLIATNNLESSKDSQIKLNPSAPKMQNNEPANSLYMEAQYGDLNGQVMGDRALVKINKLPGVEDFVERKGKYSNFIISDYLGIETEAAFNLNDVINRSCGLGITGSNVRFNTTYQTNNNIVLKSTRGDITITKDLQVANISSDSAGATYTMSNITATQEAYFKSAGIHHNICGNIVGDQTIIDAAEILNITRGSQAFKKLNTGNDGTIKGRKPKWLTPPSNQAENGGIIKGRETYLYARDRNIENHGGVLRGDQYLQAIAKGDIKNICNERIIRGEYGWLKQYDPAVISGGMGLDHEHIGIYLESDGKVINDAASIFAEGNTHINAKKGFESTARHHTFIAGREVNEKWYGSTRVKEWTSTLIQEGLIGSNTGRVVIHSSEGRAYAVGTNFVAKFGTDIFTLGDIELYSLKAQDRKKTEDSKLWGLWNSTSNTKYDNTYATRFYDDGHTRLHSLQGSIIGKGVEFYGNGHLSARAANGKVHFAADKLGHHISDKSSGFSFNSGIFSVLTAAKSGDPKRLLSLDPAVNRMERLMHANNALGLAENSWQMGREIYGVYHNFTGTGGLQWQDAFLNRYGLSGLGISYGTSKSESYFETMGAGCIQRKSLLIEAGQDVILEGLMVDIEEDIKVKGKRFIQKGQEQHSHSSSENNSISMGASVGGQVTNVGVSHSRSKSSSTHYENQKLRAGGNLDVEADEWIQDAANADVGTLTGNVNLTQISRQDTEKSRSVSASVSSSGQASLHSSSRKSAHVNEQTGIHVRQGINSDEQHQFQVKHHESHGATITTDGVNNFKADTAAYYEVHDSEKNRGFGISGNVTDVMNILDRKNDQQPLKTNIHVDIEKSDYRATHHATVHGEQGVQVDIGIMQGKLHTSSADGTQVTRDNHLKVSVTAPVFNQAGLNQQIDKVRETVQKAQEFGNRIFHREKSADIEINAIPIQQTIKPHTSISDAFSEVINQDSISANNLSETSINDGRLVPQYIPPETLPNNKIQEQQETVQTVLNATDYVANYGAEAADRFFTKQGVPKVGKIFMGKAAAVSFAANLHQEQMNQNPHALRDATITTGVNFAVESVIPTPVVAAARVGQVARDAMQEAMKDPEFTEFSEDCSDVRWESYGTASAWGAAGDALDYVEEQGKKIGQTLLQYPGTSSGDEGRSHVSKENKSYQALTKRGLFRENRGASLSTSSTQCQHQMNL